MTVLVRRNILALLDDHPLDPDECYECHGDSWAYPGGVWADVLNAVVHPAIDGWIRYGVIAPGLP